MKKQILISAIFFAVFAAKAQEQITPYKLEVCHNSTTHIIFPDEVSYVDLGSPQIMAGRASGAENVVRVKSSEEGFAEPTNISVITNGGAFYSFDVIYAEQPQTLNIEMVDFIHDGSSVNRPSNALELYLDELGESSPRQVAYDMRVIYERNKRITRGVRSSRYGVDFQLRGIYINDGMLYLHTQLRNGSNIDFDIDYMTMKIVDRKVAKRTAMQEQIITPLRAHNNVTRVEDKKAERTVFAIEKFTIPADKELVIELHERNGGRHQKIKIRGRELRAAAVL